MKIEKVKVVKVMLSLLFIIIALMGYANGDNASLISTVSLSNEQPLPFEPVGVLITVQNTSGSVQEIEVPNPVKSFANVRYAGLKEWWVEWSYIGTGKHKISYINLQFASGESKNFTTGLNYVERGSNIQHAFPEPGIKLEVAGGITEHIIMEGDQFHIHPQPLAIQVQALSGIDQKAYDFLKTTDLPKGFADSSDFMATQANITAIKKFIKDFKDSQYTNLARLGLGFLYTRLGDFIMAKHTFKQIIDNWKQANGEKLEPDYEDNERDDIDDEGKAKVDKNTMLRASYNLGTLYEQEAFKVRKNTSEAKENKQEELLKKVLKAYEFALAQQPNDYYKFILEQAKTEVEGRLKSLETVEQNRKGQEKVGEDK